MVGFARRRLRQRSLQFRSVPPASPSAAVAAPAPALGWAREIARRFRVAQWRKLVGIALFMWLFFAAYFHLLRNPVSPVTVMPVTALDRLLPFQAEALALYLSLWFYVGIAPGLAPSLRDAAMHGLWAAALCGAGLACFYFWPTAVPHFVPPADAGATFSLIKGVDAGGNACPSLHVATAMFSAVAIHRLLREVGAPPALAWLNAAWFLGIAWSTMAVRQHVALDVAAGAVLGALFALARWWPGRRRG